MKPKVKQNNEFPKWFQDWMELMEQDRASIERIRPEDTASLDGQEHSGGALASPKRRVVSGRHVA